MGRTQRALTSLVAAIPAGFLTYLLVMVFLSKADSLKTITQILAGVTLACSALVALMPFGLLLFGGKKAPSEGEGKGAGESAKNADDEEVEAVADIEEVDEDDDGASAFDVEESDADIMADSDGEMTGPASSLDEIESVDFGDEDEDDEEEVEEEEEKPAPKKRKK